MLSAWNIRAENFELRTLLSAADEAWGRSVSDVWRNGRWDDTDGFTLNWLRWIVCASVEISACMLIAVHADVTDGWCAWLGFAMLNGWRWRVWSGNVADKMMIVVVGELVDSDVFAWLAWIESSLDVRCDGEMCQSWQAMTLKCGKYHLVHRWALVLHFGLRLRAACRAMARTSMKLLVDVFVDLEVVREWCVRFRYRRCWLAGLSVELRLSQSPKWSWLGSNHHLLMEVEFVVRTKTFDGGLPAVHSLQWLLTLLWVDIQCKLSRIRLMLMSEFLWSKVGQFQIINDGLEDWVANEAKTLRICYLSLALFFIRRFCVDERKWTLHRRDTRLTVDRWILTIFSGCVLAIPQLPGSSIVVLAVSRLARTIRLSTPSSRISHSTETLHIVCIQLLQLIDSKIL